MNKTILLLAGGLLLGGGAGWYGFASNRTLVPSVPSMNREMEDLLAQQTRSSAKHQTERTQSGADSQEKVIAAQQGGTGQSGQPPAGQLPAGQPPTGQQRSAGRQVGRPQLPVHDLAPASPSPATATAPNPAPASPSPSPATATAHDSAPASPSPVTAPDPAPPSPSPATHQLRSSEPAAVIDLNAATLEQLLTLPGIGESKGKAILELRTRLGAFRSVEQLKDVKGIGDKTLEKLRPLIRVGSS